MTRLIALMLTLMSLPLQATEPFFKTHGLVFFYGSGCPHCQRFAPIVKRFADDNQALVLPLSLDNKSLPDFSDFLPATTEWLTAAFKDNPIEYPALFVVNPKTKALYPVSVGAMEAFELNARMQALIPRINAYERQEESL